MTSSVYDVEIVIPSGTVIQGATLAADLPLGFMLGSPNQQGGPRTLEETLAAASGQSPITTDLQTVVQETWIRGVGLDYDGAYCVDTETDGYAFPAGKATGVTFLGTGTSNTPIVAFAEYGGDLYIAQQGLNSAGSYGRVVKLTGGTGAISVEMRIGTAPTLLVGAGATAAAFLRDLLVADDGSGNTVLFASASDINGANGVLYRRDSAGTWTTSGAAFGAFGRNRMAAVHWTTPDGNSASRIFTISGPKTFAYTLPGADPMLLASWVDGDAATGVLTVGTTGTLKELVAFRRHVFIAATDGLYDINEMGEASEITSYLRRMIQPGNGFAVEHLDGYIYMAVGRGLIRTFVDDAGKLDENPLASQCAPGWNTPAEGAFRGYITALCVDQGRIVAAVHETTAHKSYIFWGTDRNTAKVDAPQALVWHGPKTCFGADYIVDRMVTSALVDGELRLWIAAHSFAPGAGQVFLNWVSLPIAGSPLQDLMAGGKHRFTTPSVSFINPECYLESLADSRGNKAINHILYQHTVGSRGPLDGNTKLTLKTRADPAPGQTSYTTQGDITVSPTQDVTPTTVTSGRKIQYRVDFAAPGGASTPPVFPVLDSISDLEWWIAPDVQVGTLTVRYGFGVSNINGGEDTARDPDWKTAALKVVSKLGRVTLRDRADKRWTVKILQVLDGTDEFLDRGKRVTKHLRYAKLGDPLS